MLTMQEYSVLHLSGSSGVGSVVWAALIPKNNKMSKDRILKEEHILEYQVA